MTTHATPSTEPVGRLLGWLGLRARSGTYEEGSEAPPGSRNLVREAREQLLGAMTSFLLSHDLDISPANLLIAHSAFSGINPRLARQIAARSQTHEGVTQQWLDELMEQEPVVADRTDLDRMVARLESNLETFHTSTKAARSATREYGSKLEAHVSDLEQVQKTGELVSHLADIAKVMLARQQASVGFEATLQVRNKLLSAYKDIMSMPV